MEFNANMARQLAAEATALDGEVARAETEVCLSVIKRAASSGEKSCTLTIPYNHRDLITRRLEHVGFTVTTHYDQRDRDYTSVSW